jgi:recombinational DNA repair protein RecR
MGWNAPFINNKPEIDMRNKILNSLLATIAVFWVFAVLSIPCIDEKCCVCGEATRTRSAIELYYTATKALHFECSQDYNGDIHNPNGGISR